MSLDKTLWAAVVSVAGIGVAAACGPNFPWQLFDSRSEAVAEPISLDFDSKVKELAAAPTGALKAVESEEPSDTPEAVAAERREADSGAWRGQATGATTFLMRKLALARAAENGDAALTAGVGLPPAVTTYIAGAVEFHAERYESAAKYFNDVERLPPAQRQLRAVAATYMRGRSLQKMGDAASARAAFRGARAHALAGAPDPMGLGVASLGEEARLDMLALGFTSPDAVVPPPNMDKATAVKHAADAVRLYAQQAAAGSKIALLSLREVAAWLIDRPDFLQDVASEPIVRRLLVTYVVARNGQEIWGDGVGDDESAERVIDAILAQPDLPTGDDVDRLAALAYQTARYDVAEKLTQTARLPLGLWVRAKLGLRRGDRGAAVRDWTAALGAATASAKGDLDDPAKLRLRGELAVMRVAEGQYMESLRLLFPVAENYWGDVTYIAERVLTVDELKTFVDGLQPVPSANAPSYGWLGLEPRASLRMLLGRRLIRAGRNAEAVAYFPTEPRKSDDHPLKPLPPLADEARTYVDAVAASAPTSRWQSVSRAETLFKVAMMTRRQGLEIMGTEGPPDEAVLGGNFAGGIGQAAPVDEQDQDPQRLKANRALLGPDEAARVAASAPRPDVRFHYRVLAADRAIEAADLLPQRSQAYAATLCWAARFAKDSDDQPRATTIWRRYAATGAYQPWAKSFGGTCPQPDFQAARDFWLKRLLAWPAETARAAARHPAKAAGIAAVAVLLLLGLGWSVGRWRARSTVA
ncbi:MAG: hypothetical protein JSR24_17715 [Proteobacteria bacterium]|nr:hypothetical protein [Pseudomonadota bacterium]